MKAISFRLSGKTACFRKPDVNEYAYFTYNNIHKLSLFGILGAILGFKGYTQLCNENKQIENENKSINKKEKKKPLNNGYPEFYDKLKHLKISIIPLAPCGYFAKKIQVFNNSTGYASKETGGNLIVREQWIEDPAWRILILCDDSIEYKTLKTYLFEKKSIFTPYLGKNDHFANIDEVSEIYLQNSKDNIRLSSLFIENICEIYSKKPRGEISFYFKEISPIKLQEQYHFYEYESLIFTNHTITSCKYNYIYSFEDKNYFFI